MMKMKNVVIAVATLCLAPSLAYADSGFYGLAGIGRHTTDIKATNAAAAATSADMSASKRALSVGGGYRINGNVAVEGNYYDMGSSVRHDALGAVGARAGTVSILGLLPIGDRVELFVRGGAGRMKVSVNPDGAASSSRTTGVRQFGAGGNILLSQRSFLRGEWNVWGGNGGASKGSASGQDTRAYSLGQSQFTMSYGLLF